MGIQENLDSTFGGENQANRKYLFFAQTVVLGSTQTRVGIAEDPYEGLIDGFRSFPMARSAFLTGRVLADAVRYAVLKCR